MPVSSPRKSAKWRAYNSGSYNVETLQKEKLVLDWRKRQQSRAAVRLSIEEILDRLPRNYVPELYQQKCDVVYQHIYDSYFGQGQSIYR